MEKIEAVRNEVTAEDLEKWFVELERVITEHHILPENIYNMDETGANIGDFQSRQAVVDTTVRFRYQAQPGRQEWVTAVECICADGSSIPPLIIFTGETFVMQWVPKDFDPTWKFGYNSKGWTSNEHGLKWLQQCFEPATREKANGQYRLLICDGHDSHCTSDFLAHCIEHKILVFLLVPHSSHLTQPLDATVFGPLKRILSGIAAPLFQLGISRIQKIEWLEAYYRAHKRAFSTQTIKSGFSSTGIFPFNPDKPLNRIRPSPNLPIAATSIPTTTTSVPATPTRPFPSQILTSSPSDFTILKAANSTLNQMIESGELLPTPARKFVRCLTTAAEKLYTRTSILQDRTEQQEALLAARKQRLSGKRSVIKGKFLLSTAEIHTEVVEAESKSKKRRKSTRRLSTPLTTVPPEIDPRLEITPARQGEVGIADCIHVRSPPN